MNSLSQKTRSLTEEQLIRSNPQNWNMRRMFDSYITSRQILKNTMGDLYE